MAMNFRTCMFGGFDKEDVVRFIEKTSKDSQDALSALQEENDMLHADVNRMEEALRTLHAQVTMQAQTRDALDALQTRLHEYEITADTLRRENESLRGPAAEYQNMKDHIADIEISAHRHTEEFRAATMAEIREIVRQQRDWCARQKEAYDNLSTSLLQALRRAESSVESADVTGFDDMLASLQQLEDDMQ